MQAFVVSIIAGVFFPLLPLLAEYGITGEVQMDALVVTALVYVVAVGLVSRNQVIAISSFFFATICAVMYGVEKSGPPINHPDAFFHHYDLFIGGAIICTYSA